MKIKGNQNPTKNRKAFVRQIYPIHHYPESAHRMSSRSPVQLLLVTSHVNLIPAQLVWCTTVAAATPYISTMANGFSVKTEALQPRSSQKMMSSCVFIALVIFLCSTSSVCANKCGCDCKCGPSVEIVEGCCGKTNRSTQSTITACSEQTVDPPPLPDVCPMGVVKMSCPDSTCDVECPSNPCATCVVYSCGGCYPLHYLNGKRKLCEEPKCPDMIEIIYLTDLSLVHVDLNKVMLADSMLALTKQLTVDSLVGYAYGSYIYVNTTPKLDSLATQVSFPLIELAFQLLLSIEFDIPIPIVNAISSFDEAHEEYEMFGRDFIKRQAIVMMQNAPSVDPAGLRDKIRESVDRGYHVVVIGLGEFAEDELPEIKKMTGVYTSTIENNNDMSGFGDMLVSLVCADY